MKSRLLSLLAGLAFAGLCSPVSAADPYGGPPPPPPSGPVVAGYAADGWYLRGDIGVGIQRELGWDHPTADFTRETTEDSVTFGLGFGYQFNEWFRADITGEYRTKFKTSARELTGCCTYIDWTGEASTFAGFLNGYVDLGSYYGLTPYIGIGVGFAHVMTDGWKGDGIADSHDMTNFAWAIHAGLAYAVTHNVKLDLSYRYADFGEVKTGDIICPPCGPGAPPIAGIKTNHLTSHDLRLGVRWLFASAPAYHPPVIAKY